MKKTYIQPAVVLVKTDTESVMAATSLVVDTQHTYETNDVLSKKHNNHESLWDETWDDPEEDN